MNRFGRRLVVFGGLAILSLLVIGRQSEPVGAATNNCGWCQEWLTLSPNNTCPTVETGGIGYGGQYEDNINHSFGSMGDRQVFYPHDQVFCHLCLHVHPDCTPGGSQALEDASLAISENKPVRELLAKYNRWLQLSADGKSLEYYNCSGELKNTFPLSESQIADIVS